MFLTEVKVVIDIGSYKWVTLEKRDALRFLDALGEVLARRTEDLEEAKRYIKHFEEFYQVMRRRFRDFLVPPKSSADMLMGRVIVDKVKLEKSGGKDLATIVIDRRVSEDAVIEALRAAGFENVSLERREF
jgi:hypothetical protein